MRPRKFRVNADGTILLGVFMLGGAITVLGAWKAMELMVAFFEWL